MTSVQQIAVKFLMMIHQKSSRHAYKTMYAHTIFVSSVFYFIAFVLSGVQVLHAQVPDGTSQSLKLKIASLEQSYDSQVIQILSNYFDRKKFYVDVSINAEIVNETYEITQDQVIREYSQNIMMPGLPYLPDENLKKGNVPGRTPEQIVNQNTVRTLHLINLTVNIFADSSFTPKELGFMRLIAGIAAKTNEDRGDVINISQLALPDFRTEHERILPVETPQISTPPPSFYDSIKDYILGVIILLFFIALIMFAGRFFSKPKNITAQTQRTQRDNLKSDANLKGQLTSANQLNYNRTNNYKPSTELDELIQAFFNKPQEIALLFEYWMDEDPQQGALKAAKVISTVDKHLIKSLKNDLKPSNYAAISDEIEQLSSISPEEKLEIAKNFNSFLRPDISNASAPKKHGQLTLFKFLDHISDQQIMRLLDGEDEQTAALVIDYLPEEKAAHLFDKLPNRQAGNIMLKMATLHNLSYKQHKDISSRLFDKTMDMLDAEKDEWHGSENIIPVLEKLPVSEQKRYIEQLKETGAPIGEIIQNNFVTIDQVPLLNDDIIKMAVAPLNTDFLIDALSGLEPEVIDKILSVRPKREQQLIRMELQETSETEVQNTQNVKSALMDAIRQTVKQHNGLKSDQL